MSQIRCPHCGSIQVKAMSNQPKKYPRPNDPAQLVGSSSLLHPTIRGN